MKKKTSAILVISLTIIASGIYLGYNWYRLFPDEVGYEYGNWNVMKAAENSMNSYARQKTQISGGDYNAVSNTTFIPYCGGQRGTLSDCSLYITAFNHTTQMWYPSRLVFQNDLVPDSHYYPQLIITNDGIIHIFFVFHANYPIVHFQSVNPYDLTEWSNETIPHSENTTYGALYYYKNEIILFARNKDGFNPMYEPEYVFRTSDDGQSWKIQKIIDPAPVIDLWGTIYTKAMYYDPIQKGVHITFGVHQDHNQFIKTHYYVFYSFETHSLVSMEGHDLGETLIKDEFESSCVLFDLEKKASFYNLRMALDVDMLGNVIIYSNLKNSQDQQELVRITWNGETWSQSIIPELRTIYPAELEIIEGGLEQLYASKSSKQYNCYTFNETQLIETDLILGLTGTHNYRVTHLSFITNHHPEIKGVFLNGDDSDWKHPSPTGTLFTFGKN